MRAHQVAYFLVVAGCLVGRAGWAQRAAVAPLAPVSPVVQPISPTIRLEGVQTGVQPPRPAPAPSASTPTPPRNWPQPIFLLNSRIIVSVSDLNAIAPKDIAAIQVYKVYEGTNVPARWRSLTENGLLDITLKPGVKLKFQTKSLAAIRRQAKVSGLVDFRLNGLRIEDTALRIATASIAELTVLRGDGGTIINIRLAPPKPAPPRNDPPGTIYIRGMASR